MSFRLLNPGSAVVRLFRSLTIAFAVLFLSSCVVAQAQPIFRPPVTNYWGYEIPFLSTGNVDSIGTGDVNNDGWIDVIVPGYKPYALTNDQHEGFAKFDLPPNQKHVFVADFDADGYADILDPSGIIVTNKGAGLFGILSRFSAQALTRTIVADFNGDHLPDLATASGVLTNGGNGVLSQSCKLASISEPLTLLSTDVNGDGRPDLIFHFPNIFQVLTNSGNGCFGTLQSNKFLIFAGSGCNVDLDRDGRRCVVIPQYESSMGTNLVFFTNDASGVFSSNKVLAVGQGPRVVISGDLNGDGAEDLLCQFYRGGILVLTNDLHGSFGSNSMIGAYGPMVLADLNADGKLDLLTAEPYYAATNLLIYYNAFPSPAPSAEPPLSLGSSGKGMELSWPADSKGWSLRCARDLASPEWLPAGVDGYQIETKGTNKTLHVQPSATPRFYRLMHPAAE